MNLRGTGISPLEKNPPGQKTPGEKVPSGDIFYCSGSRQLNHSILIIDHFINGLIDFNGLIVAVLLYILIEVDVQ